MDYGTRKHPNLIHNLTVNDIGEQDARFLYQSYRLNNLPFSVKDGLSPSEFISGLQEYILQSYQFSWSVRKDDLTIVIVFGRLGFHSIDVGDPIWNVKTSPRQKIEAGVVLYQTVPQAVISVGFRDKKYHELFCDYGILRRIGTVYLNGIRHAQFQTRIQ